MFTIRRVGLGLVGSAGAGLGLLSSYDEGTRRSLQFWSRAFPIYLQYRFVQLMNRDVKLWDYDRAMYYYDVLHDRYADYVKEQTYLMRGFYLKQAQLMSTQDNFVPKRYMEWVKDTQDNVPSEFGPGEAKKYCALMLKQEQGLDFDEIFSEWQEEPLGVASIGQVHRAKLRNSGKEVAVKIQLPGIERRFRADIFTIKWFCWLAMPQHFTAFDEIEKQFCTEFDYAKEGENLKLIRDAMLPKWSSLVDIPSPYLEYCSKHVLVMEFLHGVKLVDGIRAKYRKLATSRGLSIDALEAQQKLAVVDQSGKKKYKTVEESSAEMGRIKWGLFLQDTFLTANIPKAIYNYSLFRLFTGPLPYYQSESPVDLAQLLDTLCRVHAAELFHVGAFNGDPHPGNILLLEDGRLGLIDYGQVKKLSIEDRIKFAKLILAHAREDKTEVVRIHFNELGVKTEKSDKEIAYLFSAFYNDRNTEDICQGMNISEFIDWIQAQDKMIKLPEDFIMASRLSILLRGMGNAFGLQIRMSKMWENDAKEFLKNQNVEY